MYVTLFLILVLGVIMSACSRGDYELDEKSFNAKSLELVRERTGLMIPTNAHGLNMFYSGRHVDPWFLAKIEIPASSAEVFMKGLEQFPSPTRHATNPISEKRPAWWGPLETTIRSDRSFIRSNSAVHLLLCYEDGRWILYVEWICT